MSDDGLKKIISHAKEYGFVFPSSEIYDGLSAAYDYGQLGSELKNNIKQYWWTAMVRMNENIVGIDAAIFMHPTTEGLRPRRRLQRPAHRQQRQQERYRADVLIEDHRQDRGQNQQRRQGVEAVWGRLRRSNSAAPTRRSSAVKATSTPSTRASRPRWTPKTSPR